jgi:hypothetical protein
MLGERPMNERMLGERPMNERTRVRRTNDRFEGDLGTYQSFQTDGC